MMRGLRAGRGRRGEGEQERSTMPEVRSPARPMRHVLCFWLAALLGASHALGQLIPAHACALVGRPIEGTLKDAENARGDRVEPPMLGIELISPSTGEVLESRPGKPGAVDLGALFPRL